MWKHAYIAMFPHLENHVIKQPGPKMWKHYLFPHSRNHQYFECGNINGMSVFPYGVTLSWRIIRSYIGVIYLFNVLGYQRDVDSFSLQLLICREFMRKIYY